MPTTNTAELTVTHIDGTERPSDHDLLDFLRQQTRAGIVERREKLGAGTGGVQEREELAVLYAQAFTLDLDPVTLCRFDEMLLAEIPQDELRGWLKARRSAGELLAWGRRQAALVG